MISASTFRLDGKLALARGLGQSGAALVRNGRDVAKLASVAEQLRAEGLTVHQSAFDVTDGAAAVAAVGAIEILVNNAGLQRRGVFHEFKADDWQAVMRTNVDSMFYVGQAVFLASEAARFVNGHILYVDGGITATL